MVTSPQYDVIVVGAGLSGLQAAVDVQKSGLSCLILEANSRIGGKVFSVPNLPDSKVTVDAGAAWINDSSQSRMWALGQRYGAQFQKQNAIGDDLFESAPGQTTRHSHGDMPVSFKQRLRLLKLIYKISKNGKATTKEHFSGKVSRDLDRLSFKQWIQRETSSSESLLPVINISCRAFLGASSDEISALFMIKYVQSGTGFLNMVRSGKNGGQYLRPYQGSKTYVSGLAGELTPDSILTSHPVSKLTQKDSYCVVSSSAEGGVEFIAKRVIVSVPTALYRHIEFDPPLPGPKLRLSESTKMGYYTKLICIYDRPWWREAGLTGTTNSLVGPITLTTDTCIDAQAQYSLSLFLCGPSGLEWSKNPDAEERKDIALKQLNSIFQDFTTDGKGLKKEIPEPLNVIEQDWSKQEWFEGAPSPLYPVNLLSSEAGRSLKDPWRRVHFVGTETSDVWEGYMEGAVRSGERGAKEAIKALLPHLDTEQVKAGLTDTNARRSATDWLRQCLCC